MWIKKYLYTGHYFKFLVWELGHLLSWRLYLVSACVTEWHSHNSLKKPFLLKLCHSKSQSVTTIKRRKLNNYLTKTCCLSCVVTCHQWHMSRVHQWHLNMSPMTPVKCAPEHQFVFCVFTCKASARTPPHHNLFESIFFVAKQFVSHYCVNPLQNKHIYKI